jgi:hypothetical protein
MTPTARIRRQPVAARRFGYLVGVGVDTALLYLINVRPGWQVLPFLTADTPQVLGWVNAALIAGVVVNLVYLVTDPRWLRAVGELVTAGIGLVGLVRIWQVFPFDLAGPSFDASWIVRLVLVVAIIGTAIGMLVQLGWLVRWLAGAGHAGRTG